MLFNALNIGLKECLLLSSILFSIGLLIILVRKDFLVLLMGIELVLNAINLSFVAFANHQSNIDGQILVFFMMTIAAAEAAIALALAVNIVKRFKTSNISMFDRLKG